jgi:hypothetical protein
MTNEYTAEDLQWAKLAKIDLEQPDEPYPSEADRLRAAVTTAARANSMLTAELRAERESVQRAEAQNKRLQEQLAHERFKVRCWRISWTVLFVLFIVWR